jgi:hypothetical protein
MTRRLATTNTVCPPAPRKTFVSATVRDQHTLGTASRRLFVATPLCPGAPRRPTTRRSSLCDRLRDQTPPRTLTFDEDRVCPGAPTKMTIISPSVTTVATPPRPAPVERVCPGAPQRPRARGRTPLPWLNLCDADFTWE